MRSFSIFFLFFGILFAAMMSILSASLKTNSLLGIFGWSVSILMFVLWLYFDFDFLKKMVRRRGAKYGASSGINILLAVLIFLGIGLLSTRQRLNKTIDMTKSGVNTLSDQSKKMISMITGKSNKLEIVGFFDDEMKKNEFKDILRLYEENGLRADVKIMNPNDHPKLALSEKIASSNTVIFKLGDLQSRISILTEEKFANALLHVLKDKKKRILFLKGHGEGGLESSEENGFAYIYEQLKNNKYQVDEISLLESGGVPNDADLLIVSGPKYDLKKEEIPMVEKFVDSGKSLFVLVDALAPVVNINILLSRYGLSFNNDFLLLRPDDPRAQLIGQNNAIVSSFDDFHVITKDFAKRSVVSILFPSARSVENMTVKSKGVKVNMVAKTADIMVQVNGIKNMDDLKKVSAEQIKSGSFGVVGISVGPSTDDKNVKERKDLAGLTKLDNDAALDGTRSRGVRIVVVGSSQFISNASSMRPENIDLFLNSVGFLVQDEDFISIRPKDINKTTVNLSSIGSQTSLLFLSYIYPFIFLGMGFAFWLRRRRI
ncbi:MAG: GldG family protein [Oligoflexales bacterium]|nr:GldG family protein [Oligoflexales bacterium]